MEIMEPMGIATSAEVTFNGGDSKGIVPKMAERFRLRIYNKLPT